MNHRGSIFQRMRNGDLFRLNDPEYPKVPEIVARTMRLSAQLNTSTDVDEIHQCSSEIIGSLLDETTSVFAPFFTNFGRFISSGNNVFINHASSFLEKSGITIEDDVLIGPKVNFITENHPFDRADRSGLICKPILIKRNAWIGGWGNHPAGHNGGENAVVAAGAVVTTDVPANTIVAGVPAKCIKSLN